MRILNKILAIIILLLNLYFVPLTFITIKEQGGPMGYGLLTLPITLIINLLIIPGLFTLKKPYEKSVALLIINFIGVCFATFLFLLLISTPRME
jgi:hypothetical protein